MKCRTARQKIRLLVGNDLAQNEIEPVQEHIAECDPCQKHVEEMLDRSREPALLTLSLNHVGDVPHHVRLR